MQESYIGEEQDLIATPPSSEGQKSVNTLKLKSS